MQMMQRRACFKTMAMAMATAKVMMMRRLEQAWERESLVSLLPALEQVAALQVVDERAVPASLLAQDQAHWL